MRDWGGTDVDDLFSQTKASMPADAPSSLSDNTYLDIVAYILQVNAFPAGRNELSADAIKSIRIEGKNGPEPAPNFALIRTVGCLAQGPDTAWVLADAGEPVRTKNPAASIQIDAPMSANQHGRRLLMTPAMKSAESTRAAKRSPEEAFFRATFELRGPESSAAHLADWNDLTKSN